MTIEPGPSLPSHSAVGCMRPRYVRAKNRAHLSSRRTQGARRPQGSAFGQQQQHTTITKNNSRVTPRLVARPSLADEPLSQHHQVTFPVLWARPKLCSMCATRPSSNVLFSLGASLLLTHRTEGRRQIVRARHMRQACQRQPLVACPPAARSPPSLRPVLPTMTHSAKDPP